MNKNLIKISTTFRYLFTSYFIITGSYLTYSQQTKNLLLTIQLDKYPQETTWKLKKSDGAVISSGGPYTYTQANNQITEDINNLSSGNYTFTIYDKYGDGICCSAGQGSYELKEKNANVAFASGGDFNNEESTNFSIKTLDTKPDISLTIQLDKYPQETTWKLKNSNGVVVASGGAYTQAYGQIQEEIKDLTTGNYTFTIYDTHGDGICCSAGQGSYELKHINNDKILISSIGDFKNERSATFYLEAILASQTGPSIGSDPVDAIIHIVKNKKQYPNYSLIAAHRGYWRKHPENSLPAYDASIAIGADIVEMDVRLSKDGALVVLHDACLGRVTTGKGKLIDHTWQEVQGLFLKTIDGDVTTLKVLSLKDAINHLKGKALISLDIKETEKYDQTFLKCIKLAQQLGVLHQVIIKGKKNKAELEVLLQQAGVTLNNFIYTPIIFGSNKDLNTRLNELWEWADQGKIHALEMVYKQDADKLLTEGHITTAKNKGLWVGTFSFWPEQSDGVHAEKNPLTDCDIVVRHYDFKNNGDSTAFLNDGRGDWDWLLSHGADYVVTDRPHLLIEYLEAIGKRVK